MVISCPVITCSQARCFFNLAHLKPINNYKQLLYTLKKMNHLHS